MFYLSPYVHLFPSPKKVTNHLVVITVPAQFIPGRTGAGLLILNGFTFYMKNHQAHGKKQWYCSSRDVHGCRADVITYKGDDGRDYISIFRGRHIHTPPRLRQCHDGRFIREKDSLVSSLSHCAKFIKILPKPT